MSADAVSISALPAPCQICRRAVAACICVSHVEQPAHNLAPDEREHEREVDALVRPSSHRLEPSRVQYRVDEAMHLYYGRDAAGLARLIRGWFS